MGIEVLRMLVEALRMLIDLLRMPVDPLRWLVEVQFIDYYIVAGIL